MVYGVKVFVLVGCNPLFRNALFVREMAAAYRPLTLHPGNVARLRTSILAFLLREIKVPNVSLSPLALRGEAFTWAPPVVHASAAICTLGTSSDQVGNPGKSALGRDLR